MPQTQTRHDIAMMMRVVYRMVWSEQACWVRIPGVARGVLRLQQDNMCIVDPKSPNPIVHAQHIQRVSELYKIEPEA